MTEKTLTMSQQEVERVRVIQRTLDARGAQAATSGNRG